MPDGIIWTYAIDSRYELAVRRSQPYIGELSITDGGKLIHRQTTGLIYNATGGPDPKDVFSWFQIAVDVVAGRVSGNRMS